MRPTQSNPRKSVFLYINLTKNVSKTKLCSGLLHPDLHSSPAPLQAWHETKFCFDSARRGCVCFLSITPAIPVLLNKEGNRIPAQLIHTAAGPPSTTSRGCWVPQARSGGTGPRDPPRPGGHLAHGRLDLQVALRSLHVSSTVR